MTFVGRAQPLSRLLAVVEDASRGRGRLMLVSGEAGIGKTALIGAVTERAGVRLGWGTCADAERTPAFWPWTAALRGLLRALDPGEAHVVTRTDANELARLLPELADQGTEPAAQELSDDPRGIDVARLRLFDAVTRFLERLASQQATAVVLDDLQWADESSLQLLRFVAQPYRPVPLVIIGAYRHDELTTGTAQSLADLAAHGESLHLPGLGPQDVHDLVADAFGTRTADRWAGEIHRRTGGHPFFTRQLAELLHDAVEPPGMVPSAVRDLLVRRVQRLSPACRALVQAAAVAGGELLPDVLGEVCGIEPAALATLTEEGVQAGILTRDAGSGQVRLAHDLFRETMYLVLVLPQRWALHQRIADALEHRHARGAPVVAADLARHCAAAVTLDGAGRAVRWARVAARAERARLAFGEAAAHLARARQAVENTGDAQVGGLLIDLLVEEADARARAGDSNGARSLLDDATDRGRALGDAERLGQIALAVQRLGARFAMPRDAVVEVLETARGALHGSGTALEAQLTASLARELHHSVPAHRPRAWPLSEQALTLARTLRDPTALATCLLARHDVLWTTGKGAERIELAREIARLAERTGDAERHAEGLLLTANALLEDGSAAFRAVLTEYLSAAESFGQPRHDYLALTRRGALALIDGRLDDAARLIGEASALGDRIGEPDTGNVRMSQLLGLARARGDPDQLRATAAEAISWWVGVPSHAHAVAAGLLAQAGDLESARRALETVVSLGLWRDDRSYLWPVFVGAMSTAAVRLADQAICAELLAELEPVAGACGVNGALVCFMGSNAHWAGILTGALRRTEDAQRWLERALAVHRRLGARAWEAETSLELAALGAGGDHAERAGLLAAELGLHGVTARLRPLAGRQPASSAADAELRRDGQLWLVRYHGGAAHLPDLKGLADLAMLLGRAGTDVHVLELAGTGNHDRDSGPLLDATARAAYRRRLAELDEDLATAQADQDSGRIQHLDTQRAALVTELGRAMGLGGRSRALGASTTERARKAVTARLRAAIQRIAAVLPELGAHLDRSVITGTTCRYAPTHPLSWAL
jgi:hypothetical protein